MDIKVSVLNEQGCRIIRRRNDFYHSHQGDFEVVPVAGSRVKILVTVKGAFKIERKNCKTRNHFVEFTLKLDALLKTSEQINGQDLYLWAEKQGMNLHTVQSSKSENDNGIRNKSY